MIQPVAILPSSRSPFRPKGSLSRLLAYLRLIIHPRTPLGEAAAPPPTPSIPDKSGSFPSGTYRSFPIDPAVLRQLLLGLVRQLQSVLPASYVLEGGVLEIIGKHPVNAGGVADVWEGAMGNCKVAVKSLRYSSSSDYSKTCMRFYNEILACSRLMHPNVVPFIGVYSTPEHPLGLVFEYMEHDNIKEYLRSNKDVGRRELLLDIACGVEYMHGLNIAHGNLKITNILIDAHGNARIAGLGVACLQPATPVMDIDRFFHGTAPELVYPQSLGLTDTGPTKESDMYAFGVLAWEIFAGRVPFSNEGGIAGIHSMLSGRRPPRPERPELSDRVWGTIEGCWESVPSRRRTITEVVVVLDAE